MKSKAEVELAKAEFLGIMHAVESGRFDDVDIVFTEEEWSRSGLVWTDRGAALSKRKERTRRAGAWRDSPLWVIQIKGIIPHAVGSCRNCGYLTRSFPDTCPKCGTRDWM